MFRGLIVKEVIVSKALSRSKLPDLDYAFNPYIGCWHSCVYCYARLYTRIREVSENWGDIVYVKKNIVEVLSKELKYLRRGTIGVGTITDAYQPIEAVYKITRRAIELMVKHGFHTSIQTKNTLILRDLDILVEYNGLIDVGFTITTLNKDIARIIEPRSSPPQARAYALEKISLNNIKTWIFYGPVIPGLNDDQETIDSIIELAYSTNSIVLIDKLHVKKFMYHRNHPLYTYIGKIRTYNWDKFYERIFETCRKRNVKCFIGLAEPENKHVVLDKFT